MSFEPPNMEEVDPIWAGPPEKEVVPELPKPPCCPMKFEFPMDELPIEELPNEELPNDELPEDEPPKDEFPNELPACPGFAELFEPMPAGLVLFGLRGWFMESSNTPAALTWMNRHFPLGSMGSRYSWRRNRIPLVCSNSLVLVG